MIIKIQKGIFSLTFMLIVLVGIAGFEPALAKTDPASQKDIQSALERQLAGQGILKGNNLQVSVGDSTVTLTGTVSTLADKRKAENDVYKEGYQVSDNLTVERGQLSDTELAARVSQKIEGNVFYSIFDWVTVQVNEGVVTLEGWVYEPWHKHDFQSFVERVPGVIQIVNDIQILPVSIYDDQIRRQAARIIYNDSVFEPYANAVQPPIHIIVNNGKVTLMGYVTSKFQKNWATNLLTTNTDAFQVVNDLQIQQ
jgi:hyperosmotically inducible protein